MAKYFLFVLRSEGTTFVNRILHAPNVILRRLPGAKLAISEKHVSHTELTCFFAETIRLMMSLQVDRIKQRQVRWDRQSYTNPNSENYRTLEDEAIYAVSS